MLKIVEPDNLDVEPTAMIQDIVTPTNLDDDFINISAVNDLHSYIQ
jgi:hypothetical protein